VTGFKVGVDEIALWDYAPGTGAAALQGQVVAGGNTMLPLSDGTRITLVGVNGISAASFT
jgi:hypothetical protein